MWIRSVYEELKVDERIWWVCPYKSCCNIKNSGLRDKFWCSPCYGGIKFNVCGAAVEDEARCGGVLRNSDGVARALFSGQILEKDSIEAEARAVIIALDMILEIGWKGKCSLVIEVGSMEVINWIVNKRLRPWLLSSLFKEVDSRLSLIKFVSFLKADKNGNKMAVALGNSRGQLTLYFSFVVRCLGNRKPAYLFIGEGSIRECWPSHSDTSTDPTKALYVNVGQVILTLQQIRPALHTRQNPNAAIY
ncbi:hypothetical protein PVK06_047255 [Gossypium arboreum]|uniref:RNase H type-1 domain-containing protein n=1 Tax=Gossypium arboreum TaxID=29729 RepID=A0ABR0MEU0_GOSAR|nr:hypothetical protein PVK06_047255 [Gossypium arboreum]